MILLNPVKEWINCLTGDFEHSWDMRLARWPCLVTHYALGMFADPQQEKLKPLEQLTLEVSTTTPCPSLND
jgi:hypothetical protein